MNLILAFATGYTKAEYEPFLKSARLANLSNTVRIVLFTDLDKTTFQEYPFVEIVNVNDDGHKPQNQNFIAPVLRYGYYLKYLKMLCGSDDVGGIMLSYVLIWGICGCGENNLAGLGPRLGELDHRPAGVEPVTNASLIGGAHALGD